MMAGPSMTLNGRLHKGGRQGNLHRNSHATLTASSITTLVLLDGLHHHTAAFLTLAWLGRIAATFAPGAVPPLENTTSMFIQALDLGIIVPACVLAGVLLLRGQPWGYLLASVEVMKFITMGVAVSLMGLNMARIGAPVSAVELGVFPIITLLNLIMAIALIRSVQS